MPVLVVVTACGGSVQPPRRDEQVAADCERAVARAETQLERGELRAALVTVVARPPPGIAQPARCPPGDLLAAKLRHELLLDISLAATPSSARASRRLHAAGLEASRTASATTASSSSSAPAKPRPVPGESFVAVARAQTAAGRGKLARIAGDRAVALAERIGGEPARVELRRGHSRAVDQVLYDGSGRYLVSRAGTELVVWDLDRGEACPRRRRRAAVTTSRWPTGRRVVAISAPVRNQPRLLFLDDVRLVVASQIFVPRTGRLLRTRSPRGASRA